MHFAAWLSPINSTSVGYRAAGCKRRIVFSRGLSVRDAALVPISSTLGQSRFPWVEVDATFVLPICIATFVGELKKKGLGLPRSPRPLDYVIKSVLPSPQDRSDHRQLSVGASWTRSSSWRSGWGFIQLVDELTGLGHR